MRLSDEEPEALEDFLSHPGASLNVGWDTLSLRHSGTEFSSYLLDDIDQQEDGDNPHGI